MTERGTIAVERGHGRELLCVLVVNQSSSVVASEKRCIIQLQWIAKVLHYRK
jgi:hypothetical protein